MNRAERRAAAAQLAKKINPNIGYHEAGHAVGRYLTAPEMSIPTEISISHIDFSAPSLTHYDGRMWDTEATTCGPVFSPDTERAYLKIRKESGIPPSTPLDRQLVAELGEVFDRARWLEGRARFTIGSAAG